jgi:hypothetical protein
MHGILDPGRTSTIQEHYTLVLLRNFISLRWERDFFFLFVCAEAGCYRRRAAAKMEEANKVKKLGAKWDTNIVAQPKPRLPEVALCSCSFICRN